MTLVALTPPIPGNIGARVTLSPGGVVGVASPVTVGAPSVAAMPTEAEQGSDVERAQAFQSWFLSLADDGPGFFPLMDGIRQAMGAGVTAIARTDGKLDARWQAGNKFIRLNATGANVLENMYLNGGSVVINHANPTSTTITNALIDGANDNAIFYGVAKGTTGAGSLSLVDSEIAGVRDAAIDGGGPFSSKRLHVHHCRKDGLNATGSSAAKRHELAFVSHLGFALTQAEGNEAHADGIQSINGSNLTLVNSVFFSVLHPDYDLSTGGPLHPEFTTYSYGTVNAVRLVPADAGQAVERIAVLGVVLFHSGWNQIDFMARADTTVRNLTIAYCVGCPDEFRFANDSAKESIAPFLDVASEGTLENIGFIGNKMPDGSPMLYKGADVTGIWRFNDATLDTDTRSLWIELGLLNGAGTPAAEMLRSTAA